MQILQIGDQWPSEQAGGLNSYTYELWKHLSEAGVDVRGLVVGSPQVAIDTGQRVVAFARPDQPLPLRLLSLRRAVAQELRQSKIDLIADHFALYAVPILKSLRRVPSVVHFHGPWFAESGIEGATSLASRVKYGLERRAYQEVDRLIVLSHAFQHELVQSFGVSEAKVRVIPGGVDIERFNVRSSRAAARETLGWPADRRIMLSVRRLVRRMGLEALIDAVALVVSEHPDLLLMLGGVGPIGAELDTRIRERGLEQHVQRLGRISDTDLPLAYRAADFSVVPSQALEGFGLITLESLACGTPVLVTPVGGLPEVLETFAPECIFDGTSVEDIAARLKEVLAGKLVLPSDEGCRAYCVANFSWAHIAKQVRTVYAETIAL